MATRDLALAALLLGALLLGTPPLAAQPAPGDGPLAGTLDAYRAVRAHEPEIDPVSVDMAAETAARRQRLAATLGEGVIWVTARDGADLDRFFQDDNFYYLTAVDIPDIALAMRVAGGEIEDEVLFLPAYDPRFTIWNGDRLFPGPDAERATGVRRTAELGEVESVLAEMLATPATLFTLDEPAVAVPDGIETDQRELRRAIASLRLVKSDYETRCLRTAVDITCAALRNALFEVAPGNFEYQAQGAIEGTFLRLGAERVGFATICGSGPNSVTLHYNANRRRMEDGDLMVMDVGAKYQYYTADVTRTVPVNGRFTERQREIYDIVLEAQRLAEAAAKPGVSMAELDQIARTYITEQGYAKDFKHGLGHWIGMNVHDVGGRVPMEVGTLFTIEPGIYLTDEALGVRIEDDYLMTEFGAVKLSASVPSDPDALQALMAGLR